jgi:hypothetical protein
MIPERLDSGKQVGSGGKQIFLALTLYYKIVTRFTPLTPP